MPELPEVETIVRTLKLGGDDVPPLPGKRVSDCLLLWDRTLAFPDKPTFNSSLPGQQVLAVTRRGKFIQIELEKSYLLLHLRMSGDARMQNPPSQGNLDIPHAMHDRLIINFSDGARFKFTDPRKFGRVWLVDDPQQVLKGLGQEPLSDSFTLEFFEKALKKYRRRIKPLLMDQHFIAGIGNIYADEALHIACIHPSAIANTLNSSRVQALWSAIRQVLSDGIRNNGSSIDWVYRGGNFQNHFHVYQRASLPCQKCGTPIIRIVVGQRGTHYCPSCQPLQDF